MLRRQGLRNHPIRSGFTDARLEVAELNRPNRWVNAKCLCALGELDRRRVDGYCAGADIAQRAASC